jgi:hypothetical protein
MPANEVGHFPNRVYIDQTGGNIHLNGSTLYLDESGGSPANSITNQAFNFQGNQIGLGNVANGISATGSAIGNAAALTAADNIVTNVPANTGVQLPAPVFAGQEIVIVNGNATNTLKVYPDTGGNIGNAGANAAVTLAQMKGATYVAVALGPTSQWYSLSN